MQSAPYNYNTIYAEGDFDVEYRVEIGGKFIEQSGIWSMKTTRTLFTDNQIMMGCVNIGQIDLEISKPSFEIPRRAKIRPFIRIRSRRNKNLVSGWLQKGEFFIDTRPEDDGDGITTITIEGFDALRKANQNYPSSTLYWSSTSPTALQVVREIAKFIDVIVDSATVAKLSSKQYIVGFPAQYTMSEVLGSIATMYGGNFCISDTGTLLLVGLMDLPLETYYLTNEEGDCITFGTGANETIIETQ